MAFKKKTLPTIEETLKDLNSRLSDTIKNYGSPPKGDEYAWSPLISYKGYKKYKGS